MEKAKYMPEARSVMRNDDPTTLNGLAVRLTLVAKLTVPLLPVTKSQLTSMCFRSETVTDIP